MRLFKAKQVRELDQDTLIDRKIVSMELMEHAAIECSQWIISNIDKDKKIIVVAGIGNNGGDGVAITRMLHFTGYNIQLYVAGNVKKGSPDFFTNYNMLSQRVSSVVLKDLPDLDNDTVVIDALFGSGLSRPVEGDIAELVEKINNSDSLVISVDIPSGMPSDPVLNPEDYTHIIKADFTLTLQMPKINMMLADHGEAVGQMIILPIGISETAMERTPTNFFLTEKTDLEDAMSPRSRFAHKGTNGHILVVAGSTGMAGAAYLCANAALKSGAGLVTVSAPGDVTQALQVNSPEVICRNDLPDPGNFQSVTIGPGIGVDRISFDQIVSLINDCKNNKVPVVLDADGLNILAGNSKRMPDELLKDVIITPHPKEFDRLFGACKSHSERFYKATEVAKKFDAIVVLKGAFTTVHVQDNVYFNSTGNPGMGTAGSGDVLSGVISALLARRMDHSLTETAKAAVYIHGYAGDLAYDKTGGILVARDIIKQLPHAIHSVTGPYSNPKEIKK